MDSQKGVPAPGEKTGSNDRPQDPEELTCPDPKIVSSTDLTNSENDDETSCPEKISKGSSQEFTLSAKVLEDSSETESPTAPIISQEEVFLRSLRKYELLGKIGQGGMGKVFQVRHRELKRIEALKMLNISELEQEQVDHYVIRFRREVRAILEVKKTHRDILIPLVYDFEQKGCFFYYTMDFIPGRPLSQIIQGKRLLPKRAVEIVRELCGILEVIHQKGIIHRDIKPGNIIIDEAENAWLVDFGLVKGLREETSIDITQGRIGTPRYMAPEQIDREEGKEIDARCDIYAMGAVLYETITGEPAISGKSWPEICNCIFSKEPASFAELGVQASPGLEAICRKAMSKKTEDRYPSAGEFREALQKWEENPERETDGADGIGKEKKRLHEQPPFVPSAPIVDSRSRAKKLILVGIALALAPLFSWWIGREEKSETNQASLQTTRSVPPSNGNRSPQDSPLTGNPPQSNPVPTERPHPEPVREEAPPKEKEVKEKDVSPEKTTDRKIQTAVKVEIVGLNKASYTWAEVGSMKAGDFYKVKLHVFRQVWIYGFQKDATGHLQMFFPRQEPPGEYDYTFSNPMIEGIHDIPPKDGIFELTRKPNGGKQEIFYFLWSSDPFPDPQQEIQSVFEGKSSRGYILEKKIGLE